MMQRSPRHTRAAPLEADVTVCSRSWEKRPGFREPQGHLQIGIAMLRLSAVPSHLGFSLTLMATQLSSASPAFCTVLPQRQKPREGPDASPHVWIQSLRSRITVCLNSLPNALGHGGCRDRVPRPLRLASGFRGLGALCWDLPPSGSSGLGIRCKPWPNLHPMCGLGKVINILTSLRLRLSSSVKSGHSNTFMMPDMRSTPCTLSPAQQTQCSVLQCACPQPRRHSLYS